MQLDYSDLLGSACYNAYTSQQNITIQVDTTYTEGEELDTDYLMRDMETMPRSEQTALKHAQGSVLDLGAGAGIHSLYLQGQEQVTEIDALEISSNFCQLMTNRGVKQVLQMDFFQYHSEKKYDTILLLMNGLGMCKTLQGLPILLQKLAGHLSAQGVIYIESTDLKYLFEQEDGSFLIPFEETYYGEIEYQLSYEGHQAQPFKWLYCGYELLESYCAELNLKCEYILAEDEKYLAKISL